MRKIIIVSAMMAVSFIFTACDPGATTTTTASKPTNTSNAATTAAPVSAAAVEADLKKLVTETAAALAKNDADALDKMYADNYTLVNLDGSVQTKAERLAGFRSGETKFESFTYDEVNVRTNPDGTGAVVISRANAKGTNKGMPIGANPVRVTQVWSKTKDGWKQVSGHATEIVAATTGGAMAPTDK